MEGLKGEKYQYDCKEIGNTQYENIKIIVPEETVMFIKNKSKRLIGAKSFGLLIGNKYRDKGCVLIYIESAIPLGNISAASSYIFTDKRWIKIKERVHKNNPGKEILGWYGVRPGWEGMATEEDQRIHQNFFDKPWQIIYLYDKKNNSANFYYWYQNRLNRCKGYYQLEYNEKKETNKHINVADRLLKGAALIVGVLLFTGLYTKFVYPYIVLSNNKERISPENNSVNNKGEETIYLLEQKHGHKQDEESEALESDKKNTELSISEKGIEQHESIDAPEIVKEYDNTSINQIEKAGIEKSGENAVDGQEELHTSEEFFKDDVVIHIIKKGDTLIEISKQYYGDPGYTYILAKINRISDYRSLRVGDYLIIPSKDEIDKLKQ